MKMKKFLSAILSLTLLAGILSVIPASAEAAFSSNMDGWTKVTGSWDFSTGKAQSTTSFNQAVCSASVDKSNNWMWNTDISYADTSATVPYYYLRFGYQSVSGPYYYLQIGPTAASNQVAFYYYDGSANKRISVWAGFPASSDTSAFNVRISYTNRYFDAYIDDAFVVRCAANGTANGIEWAYNGGYFGLANNKIISYFNNVNLYVYNEAIETYAGTFSTSKKGYKTLSDTQKWNQAYISSPAVGKYLKIETNYKYISGNNQSYIRFGLKDDSNYFSLNMQPDDAGGKAFAVYEMVNGNNTNRSGWVSGPDGYNKSEFSIKIDVTPDACKIYIDGALIITCNITYNGGKLGLATYYTASQFNDLTVTKSVDNKITFTPGKLAVDNNDGSISFLDTGWGRSTIGLKSNSDFEISMDIKNGSGNQQYFLYFGTSSANVDAITDGYSVRIALADTNGEANIVVYDEATKTRVSPAWQPFPESSDRSSFTLTVKYLNGIARVFIDGIHILITEKLTPSGTFTYFKTNKTSVDVSGLWATVPETLIGDVNADGTVSALDLAKLRKKLLNGSEIIDETAANCNTDAGISILDLVRLKKLLSGVVSAFNGYTPTTADGCGYSANGAFKLYNTSSDFDSEKPYVYMLKNGSSTGITDVIYETKMGVYSTIDYTVEEVGYIIADGNHTLNQSAMTVDSDTLSVTVAAFADMGDFNEFKIYVSGVGNNVSKTVRGYIKTTDSNGNTEYFYSSNCCFFCADRVELNTLLSARENAILINNKTNNTATKIPSETFTVYQAVSGASYAHHPHIAVFKNKYYAIYSLGEKNEEDIGQKMVLSVSDDGASWSEPAVLADVSADNNSNSVVIPGGLYSLDGMLIAYYASFDYADSCIVYEDGKAVRPLAENAKKTNWKMYAAYTSDGIIWQKTELSCSPACNFAPMQTSSGRLIMCGADIVPYSDDISGLSGWVDCKIDTSEALNEGASIITEGAFYQTDDGILRMLFRTNSGTLYCSESCDDGVSWTRPYPTSFKSDSSKFAVGRFNNGIYYWIGNTSENNTRMPLSIYLSEDGVNFNKEYIIRDEEYTQQYSGLYKEGVYGYPSIYCDGANLYVIYSKHKEIIEITKIALKDIIYE